MVGACHYTFVKTHKMYTKNGKNGFCVMMMCHRRFIDGSKCATLMEVLMVEETVHVSERQGVCGHSLYLLLNFTVNLTVLKIKLLAKQVKDKNIFEI